MKNEDTKRIKKIKRIMIDKSYAQGISHLPSCFSCLDILYVLYNKVAHITNDNKGDILRDRVILSKEHARWGQACVLFEAGLLTEDVIDHFKEDGYLLGQDMYNIVGSKEIAAVDYGSSSLGHGLSVATGIALGDPEHTVFTIVGDGELQEGSCWEALIFIAHHNLKNCVVVIDRNLMQIDDYTKNIINTSSFSPDAIEKLGFEIVECDGHDVSKLEKAFMKKTSRPKCIVANTIKGKEIDFVRKQKGAAPFHWMTLSEEDYKKLQKEDIYE